MASRKKAEIQKRDRMRAIVKRLQDYIRTYSDQYGYLDYSDTILIDDVLYGLGIAIDPKEYYGASGFEKFKKLLVDRNSQQHCEGQK